jgi:hypothetical protein
MYVWTYALQVCTVSGQLASAVNPQRRRSRAVFEADAPDCVDDDRMLEARDDPAKATSDPYSVPTSGDDHAAPPSTHPAERHDQVRVWFLVQ